MLIGAVSSVFLCDFAFKIFLKHFFIAQNNDCSKQLLLGRPGQNYMVYFVV